MVYKRWGDYKDRQLEVRLEGSCARAARKDPKEILGGGVAKRRNSPSTSPTGFQIVDHVFVRKNCSSRTGSYRKTLYLETSLGATPTTESRTRSRRRTGGSTKPSRFGHGRDLTSE